MDLTACRQGIDSEETRIRLLNLKQLTMGRQRDSKLVGTVGNLIFYSHRGDYRMRTKPVSVKRSKASVKSGLNFGKASRIGKQIRQAITSIIPSKSGSYTMFRFTGALNKMISWKEKQDPASPFLKYGLPFISEFQFNEQADMPFAIRPAVTFPESGLMEIRFAPFIPGQTLHAPLNTEHILFKMIVTSTSLTDQKTKKTSITEIKIPCNHALFQPPDKTTSITTKPNSLILTILAVEYYVHQKDGLEMLTDLKKMPCGVVWSGWL